MLEARYCDPSLEMSRSELNGDVKACGRLGLSYGEGMRYGPPSKAFGLV
jgi:hypothetical protein